MSNDDDKLAYDLSAWDAPPPPSGLADAVIDRMGATDVAVAVPAAHPRGEGRGLRRRWIIASAAVATIALVVGVWSLIGASHRAAPTSGSLIAEHARSLSLDTAQADLDPGAEVRWRRKGEVLYVDQRKGRVSWRIADDSLVVIDAGAGTASVQATGANLRVEVEMNATDARVLGASAVTAAAVAMLTVVVYEGHVNVHRSGQPTVVVAPGMTYKIGEQQAPAPVVGATVPKDEDSESDQAPRIAVLGLEAGDTHPRTTLVARELTRALREQAKVGEPYRLAANTDHDLVDEKLLADCESETPACMSTIGRNLGADLVLYGRLENDACDRFASGGTCLQVSLTLLDAHQGAVTKDGRWVVPHDAEGDALDEWGQKKYLELLASKPDRRRKPPAQPAQPPCDGETLKEKGMESFNRGLHAQALVHFEASLRCKPDAHVLQLAFMEACMTRNEVMAKRYYKRLTKAQQTKFAQMCIRNKTAYDDKKTCDAEALKAEGMELVNLGQHNASLAKFEASLRCKPDAYVRQLAFMEACSSANAAKARFYYKQLTPAQQTRFVMMCTRQKVDLTEPAGVGYLELRTKPSAKVLIDGLDVGMDTPVAGKVLELAPGKHKVTFVVGLDRFTFQVEIQSGQTASLVKDLR